MKRLPRALLSVVKEAAPKGIVGDFRYPPACEGTVVDQLHERLAQVFGNLAIELQAQKRTADILQSIVQAAADNVPGASWAGISVIEHKMVVAKVSTSRTVAELDELQAALDQGPCLTALREHHTVQIDDMRTDTRWPAFAREAQQRGILSLLSFQLGTLGP
jgi:putative methionine-R-sulfoxide reductase with GAF domain